MFSLRRHGPWVLAVLLLLGAIGWGVSRLLSGGSSPPPRAPKISLIPSAPPPPPPPPKEERKPEPPKEQKEVKVDQPAPPRDAPPAPPSNELKMDGPAGDGPSAFSAGRITNEDLGNIRPGAGGGGGGGMFSPFNNYASLMRGELQRQLARNRQLREHAWRIEVQLWVDRSGSVSRHELIGSTGDPDADDQIRQALASLERFSQSPPERMPQPIRLRVSTGRMS